MFLLRVNVLNCKTGVLRMLLPIAVVFLSAEMPFFCLFLYKPLKGLKKKNWGSYCLIISLIKKILHMDTEKAS